jgi:hypothetical protein
LNRRHADVSLRRVSGARDEDATPAIRAAASPVSSGANPHSPVRVTSGVATRIPAVCSIFAIADSTGGHRQNCCTWKRVFKWGFGVDGAQDLAPKERPQACASGDDDTAQAGCRRFIDVALYAS